MVQVSPPTVVQILLPGLDVAVYPVMGEPPLFAGAVHETTEEALAKELAMTLVGGFGVVPPMVKLWADPSAEE